MALPGQIRPREITVRREEQELTILWADGLAATYPLRWLRANCPCASCREQRRTAAEQRDPLALSVGPPPSTEIVGAELVGNYAVRPEWSDGHATGIYTFAALRATYADEHVNSSALPPLPAL